jgi:hypothetical protein
VKPSQDFEHRYSTAKRFRDDVREDITDVYRFCANDRRDEFTRTVSTQATQEADIFFSMAEEFASDFAGDLFSYFTPSETEWVEMEYLIPVPEKEVEAVQAQIDARESLIMDTIKASNYYDIGPAVFFEANHGTIGMWAAKGHSTQALYCECVPASELLVVPGHMGILDRFREKTVAAQHLVATLPGADLSHPDLQKKMKKAGETVKVIWGFWVTWDDPGNPRWMREVTVDDKVVMPAEVLGPLAGSCPLLVGRFNPRPNRPHGRGPGRKALPDLRTVDKIEEVILAKLDEALNPSIAYSVDGTLDLSGGFIPGTAYPKAPSTKQAIEVIETQARLDYGFHSLADFTARLREAFYQDGPRQRGDTPPSATQVVYERDRVQQRLGKPSAPIWSEFVKPFIQRVEYILTEEGVLDGQITANGDAVALQPISPLQKATNADKVLTTRANLDIALGAFGEAAAQVIDPIATMQNIKDASGDTLMVIREELPQIPQEVPAE